MTAAGLRFAHCAITLLVLGLVACGADRSPTDNGDGGGDGGGGAGGGGDSPAVRVDIVTGQGQLAISPYIYGSNQDFGGLRWTIRRQGGNRMTGYNWENNFSNAGNDWYHSSDNWLLTSSGLAGDDHTPALVATHFHDQSLAMGAASILTLQMGGFVAADGSGTVTLDQTAPSSRWVRVLPRKNAPFAATPSTTDTAVYMDEQVGYIVARYGNATSPRGVAFYSLDNEPALWASTHPRIHPRQTQAAEIADRSIDLAGAVKAVDPGARILGPALYGFNAYTTFQNAPDWPQAGYRWFIDYYLDRMRQAEATAGRRLLDVLDVHWYPEAQGDHRITDAAATTAADREARLQAPRTLYDPTYVENSWIGQWGTGFLPLLTNLQQSIAAHYPGTALAVTEYNYGGGADASGGLAQADVLGAFGRYGVYIATYWDLGQPEDFIAAAFRLYRDYDGQGGTYGSTAVQAVTSDVAKTSAYAALDPAGHLHVILLNRTAASLAVGLSVQSATPYASADVWGFDGAGGATITHRTGVTHITGNAFVYTVPALAALHLVLQ